MHFPASRFSSAEISQALALLIFLGHDHALRARRLAHCMFKEVVQRIFQVVTYWC
jgi:hypothetical protein